MFKYIFMVIMSFSIVSSNDNIVKTSELELFLFKVGFESLLKDVDINKEKSSLNENEIKQINEKIELIMSELYKDNRVLLKDKNEVSIKDETISEDIKTLKNEILMLKKEIVSLKEEALKEPKELKVKEEANNTNIENSVNLKKEKTFNAIVKIDNARVREFPSLQSNIVFKLKKNSEVSLEDCDKFGWCKLSGEKQYIARQLLWDSP